MKILFLFFAAINLAFFLWQSASQGQTSGKGGESIVLPKNVKRLMLLDESKTRQRIKPKAKSKSKSKRASKSQSPASTQRLRHTERPLQTASRKIPTTTSRDRRSQSSKNVCFALGPFEERKQAKPIAKKLRELGAETLERKHKKPVSSGYWVYLSPYPSWKEARQQVLNLEAQGMNDIFIMGRGKMKNAVSLGLFRSKSAANRRTARLKKLGIQPKIEVQYSLREEYWVDLNVEARKKQVIRSINAIAKGLTLLELRPRECN